MIINVYFFIQRPTRNDNYLAINFYNIGQGDGYLIRTPDNFYLMVDAGRDSKMLDFLASELPPVRMLDAVMISHPDSDHSGMVADIVEKYRPKYIWLNEYSNDNEQYNKVLNNPSAETKRKNLVRGDYLKLGCCVEMQILWPTNNFVETSTENNDRSISFILKYNNFTFWSGGDLGEPLEEKVTPNFNKQPLSVLKIGHHGSKTSSSKRFLELLAPKLCVIQVGVNSYGHPTKEVLQTLEQNCEKVYRTDEDGDVLMKTNGYNIFLQAKG